MNSYAEQREECEQNSGRIRPNFRPHICTSGCTCARPCPRPLLPAAAKLKFYFGCDGTCRFLRRLVIQLWAAGTRRKIATVKCQSNSLFWVPIIPSAPCAEIATTVCWPITKTAATVSFSASMRTRNRFPKHNAIDRVTVSCKDYCAFIWL